MATTNYSRQREAIVNYLRSTTCHPTADTIYENIKKTYPKISLGTVYRNLNLLTTQGVILRLSCDDNKDHYDATTEPHHHFFCRCCKEVSDLPVKPFEPATLLGEASFSGRIESCFTYFQGVCPDCMNEEETV